MILNTYAVLAVFFTGLRLPLALFLVGAALYAWRVERSSTDAKLTEQRYYLLMLLALLLLSLNVVSWPLFYSVLQSYVPQWPGVMCIYGVTRVGLGSQGISRFLPDLVAALQVLKPLVAFLSGGWFVVYLANRQLQNAELRRPVLMLISVFGMLSAADAICEGTYLLIPKSEKYLDVGCCSAAPNMHVASRFTPQGILPETMRTWISVISLGLDLGIPIGLVLTRFQVRRRWAIPLLATFVSVGASFVFLIDVGAPKILRLPYHHCLYDLVPKAPETIVGIALFLLGVFAIGWAFLLSAITPHFNASGNTNRNVQVIVERLLFIATFGYSAAVILFAVEMVLS